MNSRANQSGMALLISLIMLLLLTIIAITAAQQSSLQARMSANSQQQNIAFQAAESGIQAWLKDYASNPRIAAISVSGALTTKIPYTADSGLPSNCATVIPPFSLDASGDSFQFACFNIQANAKSCVDTACLDTNNPARARHFQGHLVRY